MKNAQTLETQNLASVTSLLIELYTLKPSDKNLREARFAEICRVILYHIGYKESNFLKELGNERCRQYNLHPNADKLSADEWFLVIAEEVGEAIQAYNNLDKEAFFNEIIQVYALNFRYNEVKKHYHRERILK